MVNLFYKFNLWDVSLICHDVLVAGLRIPCVCKTKMKKKILKNSRFS